MMAALGAVVPLVAAALAPAGDWPAFLPARAGFAADVVEAVEAVWREPTIRRAVKAPPAPLPLAAYLQLVDAPDLTAAAARHLELAAYEVRMIDVDAYEASDGDGARGRYRVLARGPARRVILSWGQHEGPVLGTISGRALTVLEFEDRGDHTGQRLEVWVQIEQPLAAALARVLLPLFGHVADRKLARGFEVTARVAAWVAERPEEFCAWLARQPLPEERRAWAGRAKAVCPPATA